MGDSSLHAFSLSVLKVILHLSCSVSPLNQIHCNSIITQLSGSMEKKRYNGPRYIHATVVQIDQNR